MKLAIYKINNKIYFQKNYKVIGFDSFINVYRDPQKNLLGYHKTYYTTTYHI